MTDKIEPEIRAFLEKLMEEKQIKISDPEVREEMLNDLNSRLQAKIFASILIHLQGNQLAEFEGLIDSKTPDQTQIQKFLQANVKDAPNVIAQAMLEFREAYLKP